MLSECSMKINPTNIIIANYSIHSLALICWAIDNFEPEEFCILSVDTGFASSNWDKYLQKVFLWLNNKNVNYYHLKSENTFQKLVTARKQFPSQKFSWCAGFLKGITLLNKIDELDPDAKATILLSHRKDLSKASILLKNKDEEERYDYRKLIYPLLDKKYNELDSLIKDLPFDPVQRSCECQPCIHFTKNEFNTISTDDKNKVIQLEQQINNHMFNYSSFDQLDDNFFSKNNIMQELSKTCSWEYSCGL